MTPGKNDIGTVKGKFFWNIMITNCRYDTFMYFCGYIQEHLFNIVAANLVNFHVATKLKTQYMHPINN